MKESLHKISIIVFMLYYIVVASGVNIKLHYCEGEISDIAVNSDEASCQMMDGNSCHDKSCSSLPTDNKSITHCQQNMPQHCCSNKDIYFAINTLVSFSSNNFDIKKSEIELLNNTVSEELVDDVINDFELINKSIPYNYPPPYLAFQQLLVYS